MKITISIKRALQILLVHPDHKIWNKRNRKK